MRYYSPTKLLLQFILVFSALSVVPAIYFYERLDDSETRTAQQVAMIEQAKVNYAVAELGAINQKIQLSVMELANNGLLHRAIDSPSPLSRSVIEDFWALVARTQGYYSQLRYLDIHGQEKIRINHNGRTTQIVEDEFLQDKSGRNYFSYAQSLEDGQLGVYGIDLEIEHGEYARPYTPALRVIVPVATSGVRQGYFIANLNLSMIYDELAYRDNSGSKPIVANANGFYVLSPDTATLFGDLLPGRAQHSVANDFPLLWRQQAINASGTVHESNAWLTYQTIDFTLGQHTQSLLLFVTMPAQQANQISRAERFELFVQLCSVSAVIFLIALSFVIWNDNHHKNSLESKIARAAINGMSALMITDKDNRIIKVNDELCRISGYTFEEVKGQQPSMFASGEHTQKFYREMWESIHTRGIWQGEIINRRKDATLITELLRIQTVKNHDGKIQFYVASFVDISELKALEQQLRRLSEKDALTSQWNRRKFDIELQSLCMRVKRYPEEEQAALCLFDIDHFKQVNDQYGHDVGDHVIKSVAQLLKGELRETDLLARVGGEEFAVIMPNTSVEEAEAVSNRIRNVVEQHSMHNVTLSGGVSDVCANPSQTYKRTDMALYDSKYLGRNRISVIKSDQVQAFV